VLENGHRAASATIALVADFASCAAGRDLPEDGGFDSIKFASATRRIGSGF
jgi:hypothetical protein